MAEVCQNVEESFTYVPRLVKLCDTAQLYWMTMPEWISGCQGFGGVHIIAPSSHINSLAASN